MTRFKVHRDALAWKAGDGTTRLEPGTLIEGEVLVLNPLTRQVVVRTAGGTLRINQEDVQPLESDVPLIA